MMQVEKMKLKPAFILLRCDKTDHNDCRNIRDALLEKFPNVRNANTTNARVRGERWCVAATALVNAFEAKQFEKNLLNLRTTAVKPIGVSKLRFVLDDQ